VRAKTELERAQAALEVARRDNSIGDFDQMKVEADTAASLSGLQASLASVRETVATIESDILKLDVDLQNVTMRSDQRIVRAPHNGQIVRLMKVGGGTTVKAGDVLAVIAPETTDQAVEILLSDNDAPLVRLGGKSGCNLPVFPHCNLLAFLF
jgi:biotin carboxyl carrier protein